MGGIDKDFAKNETRNVIFYDVGSSHSSASLVEFGALSERRSKKTYGSFVVKSVEWNDEFDGEDLDVLLVNKEAPVSVEGMFEDIDFRSTIDRATFEAKAE